MTKTILVLSANPQTTPQLRLDQEIRDIRDGLQRKSQDAFKLECKLAARAEDVRRAMLDYQPAIIHFCGHGSGENGLVFEDKSGFAQLVDADTLADFFGLFASKITIECVVLNACYSEVQALAIAQHIDYVVGMQRGISDKAAIEFAVAFYDALVAGEAVEFAYKLGCIAIRWVLGKNEHLTPVLKSKKDFSKSPERDVSKQLEVVPVSPIPTADSVSTRHHYKELLDILKYSLTTDDLHELSFLLNVPFVKKASDSDNAISILEYAERKKRIDDLIGYIERLQPSTAKFSNANMVDGNIRKDKNYVPPERRIRIQASNGCNLDCRCCHWDEFEETGILARYEQIVEIMENLKISGQSSSIYPRPNIAFTLTGGEPLINDKYWERFIGSAKVLEKDSNGRFVNSTHLLTNGTQLDSYRIEVIKRELLRKIRVSLNYAEGEEDLISDIITRKASIISLLDAIDDVELRFNHVISSKDPLGEIRKFSSYISREFRNWIPQKIKGIGFIQEAYSDSIDLFSLAKEWSQEQNVDENEVQRSYLGSRKLAVEMHNKLRVEFIKLNCDVRDDYIKRCFECVQERDIAISADARVRICSGWNDDLSPKFKYAHIDMMSPLSGMSGVIKRQYGLAGFYGHFPFITKGLKGDSFSKYFRQTNFDFSQFVKLLIKADSSLEVNENDVLSLIIESIFQKEPLFRKLYEEGLYDQASLENSTQLCELLLKAVYNLAYDYRRQNNRRTISKMLLVLAYLTVDESLFSTGRTMIVQGLTEELLNNSSRLEPEMEEEFFVMATYCIATIAFEDITPTTVNDFIDVMLEGDMQNQSSEILYLKGCIYRQAKEPDKAILAFEQSCLIAEARIHDGKDITGLYKEIIAENQRSLGALKKNIPGKELEAQKHFLLSQCLGSIDQTRLKYTSLFSDGYASLLKYFADEYGKDTSQESGNGLRAYMYLSDSIALNRQFYASLVRIALLDLAFGDPQAAKKHLVFAKRSFSSRGLLTDQEYLNSIFCSLAFSYVLYELNPNFDKDDLYQLLGLDIRTCINVGPRDVECVRDDVKILRKIINHKYRTVTEHDFILDEIEQRIDAFIVGCDSLLQKL